MFRYFFFIGLSFLLTTLLNAQTLGRYTVIDNDSIYINFTNPFLAPVELHLSPTDSTKSYVKVNPYGVLKYGDTLKESLVIPLSKIADTSKIDTKRYLKVKGNFGDPNSLIDMNYRYSLPYPKGKRYKIIQSFGGKFSHNKPHSQYAIDFGTQIGDTITAVRPGTVVFIKEDSKEYCRSPKCIDKGNKIIVLHDDGSMANYVHLDFEGAIVEVGDEVDDSQPIAISGLTGFTTTPHLHLALYKSGGISIPFQFKGQKRKKLKQGKYYKRLNH